MVWIAAQMVAQATRTAALHNGGPARARHGEDDTEGEDPEMGAGSVGMASVKAAGRRGWSRGRRGWVVGGDRRGRHRLKRRGRRRRAAGGACLGWLWGLPGMEREEDGEPSVGGLRRWRVAPDRALGGPYGWERGGETTGLVMFVGIGPPFRSEMGVDGGRRGCGATTVGQQSATWEVRREGFQGEGVIAGSGRRRRPWRGCARWKGADRADSAWELPMGGVAGVGVFAGAVKAGRSRHRRWGWRRWGGLEETTRVEGV